jgi:DNA-binding NtrC family response regulator
MATPRHIIVADDDESVRATLAEILSEDGYQVSLASNGAAVRAILGRGVRVDLVVLDSLMPGEPSASLAAHLGDLRIPVVAISGHPLRMRSAAEQGLQLLEKPFRIEALEAEIEEAFASGKFGQRRATGPGAI